MPQARIDTVLKRAQCWVLCLPLWLAPCFLLSAPAHAADMNKTVRFAFRIAETGFDPQLETDRYSAFILEAIFDSLLTYDYLARPTKLIPNSTIAMPEVADGGATYTFKLKPGIFFSDDPAFKGRKRELVAQDYAYSLLRFFDPQVRSPNLYFLEGKIIGADEARARALKSGKFDYDAPVAGLEVLDRYTLRVRLKQPDYNFLYIMAMPTAGAVAREVAEYYKEDLRSHPVGSGPYVLKEWQRSSRIMLEANPHYREDYFEGAPEDDPNDRQIAANLKGRRLPLAGRIEVAVIDEIQPRWLSFVNQEFDYLEVIPEDFINIAAPNGKLAPSLARQRIRLQREPQLEITLTAYYNMNDAVIGGYTPEKIALRRAMNLAYNGDEEIYVVRKGQAMRAQGPIAPGVAGYDANFRSINEEYNPAKAKALLDLFGYLDRDGDGYREMPDGAKLLLEFASPSTAEYRDLDTVWQKSMDAIGIRIKFRKEKWPDLNKAGKLGQLQVGAFYAWGADFPDGDNFLQLLYGPNSGQSNYANFKLPEYDRLYEKTRRMPDSPERTALYQEMTKLFLIYAPWKLGVHRIHSHVNYPWLLNYKKHPILHQGWKYLDIDVAMQKKAMQ